MKIKKLYPIALLAICSIAFFSSCEKDVYQGENDKNDDTPNLSDFSTKSNVTINLEYGTNYSVDFEMYYFNPLSLDENKSYVKTETSPFIKGRTDKNGKFSITFTDMPNTEKNIYVYSPNLTVPTLLHATVANGQVTLTAETSKVTNIPGVQTRAEGDGGYYYQNWKSRKYGYDMALGTWDEDNGKPNYLNQREAAEHKFTPTEKFRRIIKGTLEIDEPVYSKYLKHEYITISEPANVFVNFISHNNSERENTLAYYVLDKNDSAPTNAPTKLTIAFPNTNSNELTSGDAIQLQYFDKKNGEWTKDFPANCKIGFVLLVDAFKNKKIEENIQAVYSDKKYNSYEIKKSGDMDGSIRADVPHMFAFMADDKLVLSFEDMPWHGNRKVNQPAHGDFRDDIFTITANPISALPPVEPGTDPEEGDKVDLTISSAGILAFEDNWPNKGDYDMNDVMFSYQRTLNMKMEDLGIYQVLSIDEVYTFMNNGASFTNAFGYEIGGKVKRDDVEVTITTDKPGNGQVLDPNLENATVMLTDNAKSLARGTTFTVKTKFKTGKKYYYSDFSFTPYNPFIVVMKNSGEDFLAEKRVEVHLPKKYKPTPKADESIFHTGDDLSEGSNYYITSGSYPFALEITAAFGSSDIPNFAIPTERKAIDESYPKFKDWATDPNNNSDWWKK